MLPRIARAIRGYNMAHGMHAALREGVRFFTESRLSPSPFPRPSPQGTSKVSLIMAPCER